MKREAARIPSLTGLRFVAAFIVCGFHLSITGLIAGDVGAAIEWLFTPGAIGVSFFFILSGFVLTWSARSKDSVRSFWRRRFAKIYPNHVVTWVATLLVMLMTGTTLTTVAVLANVTLVQAWFPDERVYYGMNTVSWSLACEMFFYLVFPWLLRHLRRLSHRGLWAGLGITLSVIWVIPVMAQLLPDQRQYWAIWVFPLARLPEFLSGMVLARLVFENQWPNWRVWPVTTVTVVAYLTSRWLPDDVRIVAFTTVPLAALIATVAAADVQGRPTPWRSRTAVWLGEISYAFYLVHQLVIRAMVKVSGTPEHPVVGVAIAVLAVGLSVLASWLLFRWVETPCMRLLRPRTVRELPSQPRELEGY